MLLLKKGVFFLKQIYRNFSRLLKGANLQILPQSMQTNLWWYYTEYWVNVSQRKSDNLDISDDFQAIIKLPDVMT